MKHNRKYQDKGWLREEYINKGRFAADIAKECGAYKCTVHRWTSKFGLVKRPKNPNAKSDYKNKRWLKNQYLIQNKTCKEIAKQQNRHWKTIEKWTKKFKLYKR